MPKKIQKTFVVEHFHHVLGHAHRLWQRLRITAHDEAEIDVKQLAGIAQEKIVQMPIADAQQIGDDAVTS